MGQKATTRGLLIVVLVSFFAFGLAHDLDHGGLDTETAVDHQETVPHVDEICALTLIGAAIGALGLRRARDRRAPGVMVPPQARSSLVASVVSVPPRCSGFQLVFPMLA